MNSDMDSWRKLADLSDLKPGEGHFVEMDGHELALFRIGEDVYCLEDSCPHRGGSLADGYVEEGMVACPWHSWRYRLGDGECESLPGSQPAACYPVRVEDGEVYVEMPQQRDAD